MVKQITIQKAREYFDLGVLRGAVLLREPMGKGWEISLEVAVGSPAVIWSLVTSRGDLRVFASLDSAANALREIGFKVQSFELGGTE